MSSLLSCTIELQLCDSNSMQIGDNTKQEKRSFSRNRVNITHSINGHHQCDNSDDDNDCDCDSGVHVDSCFSNSEFDSAPDLSVDTRLHQDMQQVITVGRSVLPLQADPKWAARWPTAGTAPPPWVPVLGTQFVLQAL